MKGFVMTIREMIKQLQAVAERAGGDREVTALVHAQFDEGAIYDTQRIEVESPEYVLKMDGCVLIID